MPTLAHKIRLNPTPEQVTYFKQACGTARFVWNWALAEWNRQGQAGGHPNASSLQKQFNAIKYTAFPWLKDIHRDAHSQPFADLQAAWQRLWTHQNQHPVFKKKGKTRGRKNHEITKDHMIYSRLMVNYRNSTMEDLTALVNTLSFGAGTSNSKEVIEHGRNIIAKALSVP